jgi:hypothetical protein
MFRFGVATVVASIGLTFSAELGPAEAQSAPDARAKSSSRSIWISMPPGGYGPWRAKVPLATRIDPNGFGPTFGRPVLPYPVGGPAIALGSHVYGWYGWYPAAELKRSAAGTAVRARR